MENIVVAASNTPAAYPIYLAYANADYLTTAAISFVTAASFTSHLTENHKHGMPGIGLSKRTSYILNRFDVFGCFLVAARLTWLYYLKYGWSISVLLDHPVFLALTALSFLLSRISEYDKYNARLKPMYMPIHIIWHISIFLEMGYFLANILY